MKSEVIVFRHLGKTGGTSLRNSITDVVELDTLLFCYGRPTDKYPERCLLYKECAKAKQIQSDEEWNHYYHLIDDLLENDKRIRILFGHEPPMIESINSRPARFFTMLRNPYTQMLSRYHHQLRRQPDNLITFGQWVRLSKDEGGIDDIEEDDIAEFKRYEKILFYEEYTTALDFMSDVLGVRLTEQKLNIHPKIIRRTTDTDRLIDIHFPERVRMYNDFWKLRCKI
jgi:hypothetical protein